MIYSTETRDRIFVAGYGFLLFAKNINKNIAKNINKNLEYNAIKYFLILLNSLLQL